MPEPAATAQPATVPALPATAETVSGAQLLDDLPPVNERAVAAAGGAPGGQPQTTPTAKPQTAHAGFKDKFGREFDPAKHRANPDGSPYLSPKGRLMPRGGRHPRNGAPSATPKETGSTVPPEIKGPAANPLSSPSPGETPGATATAQPVAPVPIEQLEASAEGLLRGSYALADSVLRGKGEWQPEDASEHNGMKSAYVAWAAAGGSQPVSPGWGFLLACVGFIAKRLQMPNTTARLLAWFPWLAPEKEKPEEKPSAGAPAAPVQPRRELSTSIA